ncbi:MAG: putative lipopolysaccharide heptosyltransferase III [Magnetococcales bacterium]|nr:putative lipopolysaccharide heptosyltransferase III [Magnetococcales bacterium]
MNDSPQRILVIKSRHIGDVLLTTALIATLKAHYPDSRITALVKRGTESMLSANPHLEAVLTFPQREREEGAVAFGARGLRWFLALRRARFDWVINTTEGDRGVITAFLSGAPKRTGLVRSEGDKRWRRWLLTEPMTSLPGNRHTVERNLDLIAGTIPDNWRREVVLVATAEAAARVEGLLREAGWDGAQPLAWIHPVARWYFKCWTHDGFARTGDWLAQRGFAVVVSSGPDETGMAWSAEMLSRMNAPVLDLRGRLSLEELSALAARCRFFVGVDSAPMHMAAAMGVPTLALFGPSGAFDWGPWPNGWEGRTTPYPHRHGIQQAGKHLVVQQDWECVPCGKDGCKGSKRSDCLETLRFEDVEPLLASRIKEILP